MKNISGRICRALREKRLEKRVSQEKLAEMIGTTQSSIARIEKGKNSISLDTVERIADALCVDFQFRLKEYGDRQNV